MFNGGSEHKFIAWPLTPIVISKGSSMASGQLLVTGRIGTTSQGYTLYENGSSVANTSTYTGTMPSTSLTAYIGQNNNNTQRYGGNMQELIHWSSNQTSNRTGIEENINSNYLIYQPTDAAYVRTALRLRQCYRWYRRRRRVLGPSAVRQGGHRVEDPPGLRRRGD